MGDRRTPQTLHSRTGSALSGLIYVYDLYPIKVLYRSCVSRHVVAISPRRGTRGHVMRRRRDTHIRVNRYATRCIWPDSMDHITLVYRHVVAISQDLFMSMIYIP